MTTIEGLGTTDEPSPLQQAFLEHDGYQCGYCTPGMILRAYSLLMENPNLSREDIIGAMDVNLCRCGAYAHIFNAVADAARHRKG